MALFFDLSIPYLERDDLPPRDNKPHWDARVRSVARAMELGYAAVAYDRPFRGVAAEADRCRIAPLRLAPLLARAPALASSVALHRDRLGAPAPASDDAPLRQYTRVTVLLDGRAAAAAIGAGNPVLRSYDIVAARPTTQDAFNEACTSSDIDLISIDFSQKLPFRLKRSMVEAAIKRGVHFEITYSHLIVDVHVRRQMLSDARILVDWTRGKNLIISSAASTANELRGPCDVVNLSAFLLGLSMERAKAALSRNCRSLVVSALRKKHCYKQAIRIERILTDEQLDPKRLWFGNWSDWDPISSGEGDLPPLEKLSAASTPKNSVAVGFMSVVDETRFKDGIPHLGDGLLSLGNKTATSLSSKELESSDVTKELASATTGELSEKDDNEVPGRLLVDLLSPLDMTTLSPDAKESCETVVEDENSRRINENDMVLNESRMPSELKDSTSVCKGNMMPLEASLMQSELKDSTSVCKGNMMPLEASLMQSTHFEDIKVSEVCMEDHIITDEPDANSVALETSIAVTEFLSCFPSVENSKVSPNDVDISFTHSMKNNMPKEQVRTRIEDHEQKDEVPCSIGINLQEFVEQPSEQEERAIPSIDDMPLENTCKKMKKQGQLQNTMVENDAQLEDVLFKIEKQKQIEAVSTDGAAMYSKAGKRRREESSYRAYPLPVKHLLKPMFFKKVWRLRRLRKHK